jgi:hypothetical protein
MRKSEEFKFEDAYAKILRYYRDESGTVVLDPVLEARLNRWKMAREYIHVQKPLTDTETVKFLMKYFEVSEPQAWRDVRDTKRFFAAMEPVNKEFDRIMWVSQVKDLRAKAELAEDYKTMAVCDKNLKDAGQADGAVDESAGVKNITLVVGFNPKLVGAKEIPNLYQKVEQFIGEAAKRELMMDDDDWSRTDDGN